MSKGKREEQSGTIQENRKEKWRRKGKGKKKEMESKERKGDQTNVR